MAKRNRKEKAERRSAAAAAERTARPSRSADINLPGWLPAALFVTLALVLFREFVFSDRMLFGSDTLGLGYVARAFYAEALTELGTFPRWAPRLLGGTPFIEALAAGDSLYPPSVLLLFLMEPYRALGWKLVLHVGAAGFFMFGWVRALGASRPAALLGGVAYMLAPFFVSLVQPGHDGKIFVTALAPLLFWAVERHFIAPRLRSFASIALVVALVIFTTHFQMAYFLFSGVGAFAAFRAIQFWRGMGDYGSDAADAGSRPSGGSGTGAAAASAGSLSASGDRPTDALGHRPLRPASLRFGLFLAAAVTGAGIAAVQFLPAADYVTSFSRRVQTTRDQAGESGVAWSSSWSIHPEEAMSLVIPEFAGNNSGGAAWSQGTYWGRNAFKDNHEYAGLIVLLLAAVSFMGAARRGVRLFLVGMGTVALLFALGANTPVWRLFYEVLPGIRLFRAPSQAIFLFGFSAVTLAALGFDRILQVARDDDRGRWKALMRVLWGGTAVMGVLALLAASGALTSLWTATLYRSVAADRLQTLTALQPFIAQGAGIGFILALGATGSVWAFKSKMVAPAGLLAALVTLAAVDALRVDRSFIETLDFAEWSAPDANIQALLDREGDNPEPYRLASFRRAGQDVLPALHGIELAAGHHPNDLSRYRELIGMVGSSFPRNLLHPNVRGLLNVRYILWPDLQMGQSIDGPVVSRLQLRDGRPFETLHEDRGLPRARLVGSAVVKTDQEAVPYILSASFDPETEVVLAEESPISLPGGVPAGSVTWDERTPNQLRLTVRSDAPAMLVVADNWHPAWQATVDGVDVPLLRAYHTLRAVPVPAGESTVEMVYRSAVVTRNLWLSIGLFLGLLSALSVQWIRARGAANEAETGS